MNFFFCRHNIIMYVIIGKQKCIQLWWIKENLLDEEGKQENYLDITEMPNKTMTYLRMYCNSFPIVLNINHSFSNFEETLTHFNQSWIIFILFLYYYYCYIIIIILATPQSISIDSKILKVSGEATPPTLFCTIS